MTPLKRLKPKRLFELVNLSAEIAETKATDAASLTFMARPFIQATLPHRDPGLVPEWHRKNGNLTLSIRPGWAKNPLTGLQEPIGIPFGTIPRLIILWMTSEAKKTGNKKLYLGESLARFMSDIGLNYSTGGGKRSDFARLKDQMRRLLRCTISFDTPLHNHWLDLSVTYCGKLNWDKNTKPSPDESGILNSRENSWIQLSDGFFDVITSSAVPLDMRIIHQLKQSPLALDLYAWMTHRTYSGFAEDSRKSSSFVPWKYLHDQFGSNYKGPKEFKRKTKQILKVVQSLSQNNCIQEGNGGLYISQKLTKLR